MTSQDRAASSAPRRPMTHHKFPSSGFEIIDLSVKVEEEALPLYNSRLFYPVRIGEVLGNRYQVVAKLGYGTTSTMWLCHDLLYASILTRRPVLTVVFSRSHRYVTLKVHVNALTSNRELDVYQYLKGVESDHPGREMIRMLENPFKLQGPYGMHDVFVLPPLGLSLRAFQEMMPSQVFARPIVVIALQRVLAALDFLHGPANLTHTDVHAGNLLIGIDDESQLAEFEEAELARPSSRKIPVNGNWRGIIPIPKKRTLDSLVTSLEEGKDRDEFLDLVQGFLRWLPEERLNSYEAFSHPWVSGS
ncbi:hypothetical protein Hte_010714 [Hypoxylon texense]